MSDQLLSNLPIDKLVTVENKNMKLITSAEYDTIS